jgi:hypothetical protein
VPGGGLEADVVERDGTHAVEVTGARLDGVGEALVDGPAPT